MRLNVALGVYDGRKKSVSNFVSTRRFVVVVQMKTLGCLMQDGHFQTGKGINYRYCPIQIRNYLQFIFFKQFFHSCLLQIYLGLQSNQQTDLKVHCPLIQVH